ncbi:MULTISPECIES: holo-ACP synthase [Helicobacter]|uniref:Holo-[acyl-carrier-protein] synthase n=2 Tax=Helicobacter TaxID=209 RepID=A0A377J5R2_9HELI|nr:MULTISPECIES: holo-ACP synthase [Helicobacter]MDL0080876.1 holo-ACP synthase [Helicobacter sp. CPD2-1]MDL0082910.1 holo-ACP synthase [Helicobacter sp. XJK30-2]STO97604.1 Holo-[acyl-carrier protein] synthase [Helicobacter canis]
MIGIDLVKISRVERAIERYGEKFLARFLCESEREILAHKAYAPRSVAGFWAAKEACAKALGVGIGDRLRFVDMCLSYAPTNAPLLKLDSRKCAEFGVESLAVSVSHDGGFAIAVVAIKYS